MKYRYRILCTIALLVCGAAYADPPAVFDVPALVQAEAPTVEHDGGLGNLAGLWAFWSNGKLTVRYRVADAGLYKLVVRAAGTSCLNPQTGERYPHMRATVDDTARAGFEWDVKAAQAQPETDISPAVELSSGVHDVSVAFTNDFGNSGGDRNLFVDWVGLGPVESPDATPSLTVPEVMVRHQKTAAAEDANLVSASGWGVWQGARLQPGNGLLTVTGTDDSPWIVSPRTAVDAGKLTFVCIWMKLNRGSHGEIGWVLDGKPGLATASFDLIPDNQFHLYAIDLGDNTAWDGRIIGLTVRCSDAAGAVAELKSVRIANRPVGPAELRINYFGLRDAFNRAGMNAQLLCEVENIGGEPARDLTVALRLPENVRLVSGKPVIHLSEADRKTEVRWTVRCAAPSDAAIRVDLRGANFAVIRQTSDAAFTPKVTAQPALVNGKPYVPQPQPAKSNYLVGAYYFPGWHQGDHTGWTPIRKYPDRQPVLGWYQEGAPDIADWQIKWAVEHGISFFAYDWYWMKGSRHLESALHNGFLKAKYRSLMKFCLLWANHNPPGTSSEADLLNVTRFWIDHYFKLPEYLKIDNKPVIIMFSPGRITQDMGVAKTKEAFDKMRALCREAGFNGLYLVGCAYPGQGCVDMHEEGYDAATGYNYPSAGAKPSDTNRIPYDSAIEGYHSIWEQIAGLHFYDYIPVTDPGWDSRPWHGDTGLIRTGKDPAKFKQMLELARTFADQHPVGNEKKKVVLVEAWNEFGEGDYIEPTRGFGFGFLDAIQDVFTAPPHRHDDIIPADVGLSVEQWKPVVAKTDWEFNTAGDGEGWGALMGMADFRVADGVMSAHTVTNDPAFACDDAIAAENCPRVVIRMKLSKGTSAQLFWTTGRSRESERNSIHFATIPDGQFHDYTVDLTQAPTWRGDIMRLRLDPNSDTDSDVAVDFIRFVTTK